MSCSEKSIVLKGSEELFVFRYEDNACKVSKEESEGIYRIVDPSIVDGYWMISESKLMSIHDDLKKCSDCLSK